MRMIQVTSLASAAGVPMKAIKLASLATTSAIVICMFAGPALAQQQGASTETVVVTGSRAITNGVNTPTPTTVLSAEDIAVRQPASISEALKQLPQFTGSTGPSSSNSDAASPGRAGGTTGESSGTYLNLRGLGTNRVLILQDGDRVPANSANSAVDTSLIPQMLVQRVDVVTGGGSAAYGSDAVSGVVNFVTDKKFEGVKGLLQGGITGYGDMSNYRVGIAGGISLLNDRLHLIGSAEFTRNEGIENENQRPLGSELQSPGAGGIDLTKPNVAGTAANPFVVYPNVAYANLGYDAIVANGPLAGMQFLNGTTLVPAVQGPAIGGGRCLCYPNNGHQDRATQTLMPSTTNPQFYGRAQFDITPDLDVWASASYATNRNRGKGAGVYNFDQATIFPTNAYLPAAALAALGPNPQPFTVGSWIDDTQIPLATTDLRNAAASISGGIEGKFGDTWTWDVVGKLYHGSTNFQSNQVEWPKFSAAIDAVKDPSGNIVCRVTLTNPGMYPGCQPINILGRNLQSQASRNYIEGTSYSVLNTQTENVEGNLRGEPFSTWAGPVAVAVGGAYRHEGFKQNSNSGAADTVNAGIRGLLSQQRFIIATVEPGGGGRGVTEGYGEVAVPLLKDEWLVQSFDVDLAARVTNYSTSGAVTTWKAGVNWKLSDDFRFRFTRSRDIRAPSLNELFGGVVSNTGLIVDTHTGNLGAFVANAVGGTPSLRPEVSNGMTIGAVLTPSWAEGLTASADFYTFDIDGAIGQPYSAQRLVDLCTASNGTSPLCNFITRPFAFSNTTIANTPTHITVPQLNIGSVVVKGLDFEIGYHRPILEGEFRARLLGTYMLQYDLVSVPGATPQQLVSNFDMGSLGAPLPRFRGTFEATYAQGPWAVSVNERVIGGMYKSALPTNVWVDNDVKPMFYTDVNVTYDIDDFYGAGRAQLFFNGQNVLDTEPPLLPLQPNPGIQAFPTVTRLYDTIGPNFIAGIRFAL